LRVPKIHRLVHELVNHDKVVPDALLLELAKVVLEDLCKPVQEEKNEGHVAVALGHGQEKQIVALDVHVGDALVSKHWPQVHLVLLLNVQGKVLRHGQGNVPTVITRNNYLALCVHYEYG
jgi:hypothetical protein